MTVWAQAVRRAYSSVWTLGLLVFELLGATVVGMHSRTTSLWPFGLWLLCAPLVRFFYLHKIHGAEIPSWKPFVRAAYGITGWLLLLAGGLAGSLLLLSDLVRRLPLILAFLGHRVGLWGIVPSTLVLATLLVAAITALLLWAGLTTIAYTCAVVRPSTRTRDSLREGLRLVRDHTGWVVGITLGQAILVVEALGAQLLKQSGVALMPLVWPAAFFGPVALVLLLAVTEGACSSSRALRTEVASLW